MYYPSVAEYKMINLASGAFQTTNKSKCLQEILQGLVCQDPQHPCILMPRENDEAAKKLDMTTHLSHHLCVSSRSFPFSPRFNWRTEDGARALHNTEVVLRRAAGENKAIIRRIRRTFSQVALRLSCERCFDAGSELGSDVFLSHQMNLILLMQAALNARGVGGEP